MCRQKRRLHKFYLNRQRAAEKALDSDELVFGPKGPYWRKWAELNRAVARRIDLTGHYGSKAFHEMEQVFCQKAIKAENSAL